MAYSMPNRDKIQKNVATCSQIWLKFGKFVLSKVKLINNKKKNFFLPTHSEVMAPLSAEVKCGFWSLLI